MKQLSGVYGELQNYEKEETDQEKLDLIRVFKDLVVNAVALYKGKVIGKDAELTDQPLLIADQLVDFYKKHLAGADNETRVGVRQDRSVHMHVAANHTANDNVLWKIGDQHVADIRASLGADQPNYELMSQQEFNADFDAWNQEQCIVM